MSRRDPWSNVLLVAIAFLVAAWIGFAWTTTTGLTFVGSRSRAKGRIATAEDRARVREVAVITTIIAGPAAVWAAMKRRR